MLTLWRCSGVQYHAFWQRLHHMEVGRQQMMHGWLMSDVFMVRIVK